MRFEENELGARSQGVLGSGNTPIEEHRNGQNQTNGYFRSHAKSSSTASSDSTASDDSRVGTPVSDRSNDNISSIPTSTIGRPTVIRHLSLIAKTAMNLSADQAGSRGVKYAKAAARNTKVRESLPPGVGFAGLGMNNEPPALDGKETGSALAFERPRHTRTYARLEPYHIVIHIVLILFPIQS